MTRPVLSRLNLALLALLGLATLLAFAIVPVDGSLPIHWNVAGEADGFAPAPVALLLPAVMAAAVVGLLVFLRPHAKRDFEAGHHVIEASVSAILGLALLLLAATVTIGLGYAVDMPRLIVGALGVIFLVLGNYLPKTQPNAVAGIRLPWTLGDAGNWRVTHRWTGRLMMLGGGVALLASIGNAPPGVLFAVVIAAALLPALAGVAISYRLSRR